MFVATASTPHQRGTRRTTDQPTQTDFVHRPHTWRNKYPESLGQSQSPVNIVSHQAVIIHPSTDLVWHRHRSQPMSMTLMNDGHTALLHVTYLPEQRPQISGGSLNASYELFSLMFHWGPSDDEGSEHTIDSHRFPLELQMIYHKTGFSQPLDAVVVGDKTGILIVAYLFEVKNASLYIYSMTPVVYWSEFPATDADVPRSIPGLFQKYSVKQWVWNGVELGLLRTNEELLNK
uniref:Alpha-carbonic anhydrase domain-containing protein n=1 Tax=Timema tahoe TaxID=61484 RepID=A0A7R9FN86_9NEOP|nr:unnamed protein product [Timema tahoe]